METQNIARQGSVKCTMCQTKERQCRPVRYDRHCIQERTKGLATLSFLISDTTLVNFRENRALNAENINQISKILRSENENNERNGGDLRRENGLVDIQVTVE